VHVPATSLAWQARVEGYTRRLQLACNYSCSLLPATSTARRAIGWQWQPTGAECNAKDDGLELVGAELQVATTTEQLASLSRVGAASCMATVRLDLLANWS